MAQQVGMKRARKVLQRKQAKAKLVKKNNIKQAIYAFNKALKTAEGHEGHDHDHDHDHDHEGHEGHDHD